MPFVSEYGPACQRTAELLRVPLNTFQDLQDHESCVAVLSDYY
jgi:hypothetical protein